MSAEQPNQALESPGTYPVANEPRGRSGAQVWALLLSLLLVAVAVVIARELWSLRTDSQLQSWLEPMFATVGRAKYETWMLPAGIASAVVGVLLLLVSLWPRPHTHVPVASTSSVWMRPVDVARMCTAIAEKTPGVLRASSFVTPRSAVITIVGDPKDPSLIPRVQGAIDPQLELLASPPTLQLKVHNQTEAS